MIWLVIVVQIRSFFNSKKQLKFDDDDDSLGYETSFHRFFIDSWNQATIIVMTLSIHSKSSIYFMAEVLDILAILKINIESGQWQWKISSKPCDLKLAINTRRGENISTSPSGKLQKALPLELDLLKAKAISKAEFLTRKFLASIYLNILISNELYEP